MAKVITFSRYFPKTHPRSGEPTYFVEQILNQRGIQYKSEKYLDLLLDLNQQKIDEGKLTRQDIIDFQESLYVDCDGIKHHTIRNGNRFNQGDCFSPRVWSKNPYNSPQIIFLPVTIVKKAIEVKMSHFFMDLKYFGSSVLILGNFGRYNTYFLSKLDKILFNKLPYELLKNKLHSESYIDCEIYKNDGLSLEDFIDWFIPSRKIKKNSASIEFFGQIICWSDDINY